MADAISIEDDGSFTPPLVSARAGSFADLIASLAQAIRLPFTPAQPDDGVDALIRAHRKMYRRVNVSLLRRAYHVAYHAHRGQMRKSGDPYITHPLAVATILAQLGMDTTTLVAALLHDTVEDTRYTLSQLRVDFGKEVAHLVDGVTKLDKVHFGGVAEAETTRKMIVAAAHDVRVLLIKLADRLHNMRTLGAKSRASQIRIATVTRDILVPLAGRLGVQVLKRELEDLVLAALEPEAYADVNNKVVRRAATRTRHVAQRQECLAAALTGEKIVARLEERPRHYTSIYEAQLEAGSPDHLVDDPRVVIIVRGGDANCYAALGVVHSLWRPVPGRFKDFIATPKFNLYKSLHTTVMCPDHQLLDVLIRTEAMHEIAEYGIAARHRREHQAKGTCEGCWASQSADMEWLQRLLEWQHEAESSVFLESLRFDLADHEIGVFTPEGDTIALPVDATPVDFAYAIDTNLGDRCIGARVNGKLASLSSPLREGDAVEILLAPSGYTGPERSWLGTARSPRAQYHIRRWFEETPSQEGDLVKEGRRKIDAALASRGRLLVYDPPLNAVARAMGCADLDALYVRVAHDALEVEDVVDRLLVIVDAPYYAER